MKKLAILSLLIFSYTVLFSQQWKQYPHIPEGSFIEFPSDEGRHPGEPVEWWYTTGHLEGESSGRSYSYMLTYFYYPVNTVDGFRIFNISDDGSGSFLTGTKALIFTRLSTDSLDIEAELISGGTESWSNITDEEGFAIPFSYQLSAAAENASLDLRYDGYKPPLILADSGLLKQGSESYTYYYSQTGNRVSGSVSFNGITENVSGTAWIDRQYGTTNPSEGVEYEWFSIQLSNGMDINVNNIFTADNSIPETPEYRLLCAYVDEDTRYTDSSFEIERLEYAYSPDSLRCYSQKWRLSSGIYDIDLIITALHHDYEVPLPFRFYEGPVSINGTVEGSPVEGKGFAELLHSYEKPDIDIHSVSNIRDESTELKWCILNPDHGNPLQYDLEYSIDNRQTFSSIARSLDDTLYYWNSSALPEQNDIWLKVRAYSVDSTLCDSSIVKVALPTGVETRDQRSSFSLFPNPGNGRFTVRGENMQMIEIYDIRGRKVFSSPVNDLLFDVDISNEPDGLYFVKVFTDRGIVARKVMIE